MLLGSCWVTTCLGSSSPQGSHEAGHGGYPELLPLSPSITLFLSVSPSDHPQLKLSPSFPPSFSLCCSAFQTNASLKKTRLIILIAFKISSSLLMPLASCHGLFFCVLGFHYRLALLVQLMIWFPGLVTFLCHVNVSHRSETEWREKLNPWETAI